MLDATPCPTAPITLSLPGIHCAGCIAKVERGLAMVDGVRGARVNLGRDANLGIWPDLLGMDQPDQAAFLSALAIRSASETASVFGHFLSAIRSYADADTLFLAARPNDVGFYRSHGFTRASTEFLDADLGPSQPMRTDL